MLCMTHNNHILLEWLQAFAAYIAYSLVTDAVFLPVENYQIKRGNESTGVGILNRKCIWPKKRVSKE
jgi:hypothetical protein